MLQKLKDAWKETPMAEKCVILADTFYIVFYILAVIFVIKDSDSGKNKYSKM